MAEPDADKHGVFDEERILRIVELMKEHDLQEVDLREAERQIRIKRGGTGPAAMAPLAAQAPLPPQPASQPPAHENSEYLPIKSPMVGTFYSRANPNAQSYVKVGDHVEPETTVCIIEAMKVFNEIPAEVRGKVVAVLVDDEEAVEFGTPLFRIDPNG